MPQAAIFLAPGKRPVFGCFIKANREGRDHFADSKRRRSSSEKISRRVTWTVDATFHFA